MKTIHAFTVFFSAHDVLSNWYPCLFVVNNQSYNCVEQFLMHQKALIFGDTQTAQAILKAKHPREQKRLGRKVKNFQDGCWNQIRTSVAFVGTFQKFHQNPSLASVLLATTSTILLEGSKYDNVWGAGLEETDPRLTQPHLWPGQNLLGQVLMNVRSTL